MNQSGQEHRFWVTFAYSLGPRGYNVGKGVVHSWRVTMVRYVAGVMNAMEYTMQ